MVVPDLEEKCVRAIVGESIKAFNASREDPVALDSAQRTIARVHELLDRLTSTSKAEPWLFETKAYFHEQIGDESGMFENLMKEYRALQAIPAWEKDDHIVRKVCQVASLIAHHHRQEGTKESLVKCKFLLSGVINRICKDRTDESKIPDEVTRLQKLLEEGVDEIKKL